MTWTAEDYLAHSAKGTHWEKKDHKYIKKEGNRYYYDADRLDGKGSVTWTGEYRSQMQDIASYDKVLNESEHKGKYMKEGERYSELRSAANKSAHSDRDQQYGATGMPSSVADFVASKNKKKLKDLEADVVKQDEIDLAIARMNIYRKGAGGMPTDVIRKVSKVRTIG